MGSVICERNKCSPNDNSVRFDARSPKPYSPLKPILDISMNKIIIILLLFCFTLTFYQNISFARGFEEGSCGAIHRDSLVFLKNYRGEKADMITVGLFTGYVMASLNWYRYVYKKKLGEKPNISPMVNVGQLAMIYARYLENNPDQHHKNGMICFTRAMKEAFSVD